MDPRIRYCVELDKIKDLPDFQRVRAETRLFLLKEYLDTFLPNEAKEQGEKFGRYQATKKFCRLNNIPERTLYNWLKAYKQRGIEGLIPYNGSSKWRGDSLEFQTAASPRKKKSEQVITVRVHLPVHNPLACLASLVKVIENSQLIPSATKKSCAKAIKGIYALSVRRTPIRLNSPLTREERKSLEQHLERNPRKYSARVVALLMMNEGRSLLDIGTETSSKERTIYRWLSEFNKNRLAFLEPKKLSPERELARETRRTRIIDILHKPPSLFNINRTTWTYSTIAQAYKSLYDDSLTGEVIKHVIKSTGYSWRRARKVLTSPDLHYKEKIEKVLSVLERLDTDEAFFFVDEVGPYRVKKYGGKFLMAPGETTTIPERQKSKGRVQFVAALDAVLNQVFWIFTGDKSSSSLITLMQSLVVRYSSYRNIYFTWDAISVHHSKLLQEWIDQHNRAGQGPKVLVVPLPVNSQFLNVIEAVFSGMKRAVIWNSNYASATEMQNAIARHFAERNQYYKENPKRAGSKIWDRQAFDLGKLAGGLFRKL